LPGCDEKIPFVCYDVLTIMKLKDDFAPPHQRADIFDQNAGFFPKFSERRLFKGLSFVNGTAGRGPKVLASECPFFIDKPEQQNPPGSV